MFDIIDLEPKSRTYSSTVHNYFYGLQHCTVLLFSMIREGYRNLLVINSIYFSANEYEEVNRVENC